MSLKMAGFLRTERGENSMDALKKVTLKSLQKNKKRTIVTLMGIIMATALITAVANLGESFRASMVAFEKRDRGDFHYCFQGLKPEKLKYFVNNRNIETIGYEKNLGYALLSGCGNPDKPYLFVKAMNPDGMRAASLKLIQGRMPENSQEIVISSHIRSNGSVNIAIGEELSLTIGDRETENGYFLNQSNPYSYEEEKFVGRETKTYTVVGIMERPNFSTVESYTAPGYTVVTLLSEDEISDMIKDAASWGTIAGENVSQEEVSKEELSLYVTYTPKALKHKEQVTAGLLGVPEELYVIYQRGEILKLTGEELAQVEETISSMIYNRSLIRWQLLDFSNDLSNMLYAMSAVAVAIIIVTSAFCIHNSFMISLSEKMRLYGMISSVGATKKQRRKMVYTEAVCLGIAGIPLGVLCGTAATLILVKVTGHLMMVAVEMELVYVFSVPAMIVGAVLSVFMIYLSAGRAAGKAAKLSPISAIRNSDAVKIKGKELRTPGLIHKFFGIGGVVAYKNLKRSRGKYRTTVISIVVSVSVFIGMSTFIQLAFKAGDVYHKNLGYQLWVSIGKYSSEDYQKAMEILQMEGVTYGEIQRNMTMRVETKEIPFNSQYLKDAGGRHHNADGIGMSIVSLGEDAYEAYLKKVRVDPAQIGEKAVIAADYSQWTPPDAAGNSKHVEGMMYDYHPGDVITGYITKDHYATEQEARFELAAQTNVSPLGRTSNIGTIVVSDDWMNQHEDYITGGGINLYLQCKDAGALESAIRNEMDLNHFVIFNAQKEYDRERAFYMLFAIFLYGFIAVIALIGVTNIFNTVTTNMELRFREFAILKAVGMTNGEFKRLVQLESLFYGVKALSIGIPMGLLLSLCFHRALAEGIRTAFTIPVGAIVISVVAVFLLLYGIMRYSMAKIGRKDLIWTMQNENI